MSRSTMGRRPAHDRFCRTDAKSSSGICTHASVKQNKTKRTSAHFDAKSRSEVCHRTIKENGGQLSFFLWPQDHFYVQPYPGPSSTCKMNLPPHVLRRRRKLQGCDRGGTGVILQVPGPPLGLLVILRLLEAFGHQRKKGLNSSTTQTTTARQFFLTL